MATCTPTPVDPARLRGQTVLLAGAGVSGRDTITLLGYLGAAVIVVDDNAVAREQLRATVTDPALTECMDTAAAITLLTGAVEIAAVITSPGWPPHAALFLAAQAAGVPVVGDIDLAYRADSQGLVGEPRTWVVITGTNGKTTTTGMTQAICAAAGLASAATGNIGTPPAGILLAETRTDVLICELSSFQLYWAPSVIPAAGVVLNIADDHLDWHGGFAGYAAAKLRALTGAVALVGDDTAAALAAEAGLAVTRLRLQAPGAGECGIVDGVFVDRRDGAEVSLADTALVQPPTPALLADALAAAVLARSLGITPQAIATGLAEFAPFGHRGETVATIEGVDFIDNSKATNPHAAAIALAGYEEVVLIAGGQLKGADITALISAHAHRLRAVVVLGVDAPLLLDGFTTLAPDVPVHHITSTDPATAMGEAVVWAYGQANSGNRGAVPVLLAPAAASLDMFTSMAHRGDLFAEAARALPAAHR